MRSLLLLLAGCPEVVPEEPSYATDIAPIYERHCVRCHTGEGRRDGGVELNVYRSARSSRVRSACTTLDPSVLAPHEASFREDDPTVCDRWPVASMPPGALDHLSLFEQETLARWVATGAQP